MLENDAPVLHANRTSRQDELTFAQRQHGTTHQSCILHALRDDQQNDRVEQSATKNGHEGNRKQDERHCELHIDKAHERHVPETAIITRNKPHDGANDY